MMHCHSSARMADASMRYLFLPLIYMHAERGVIGELADTKHVEAQTRKRKEKNYRTLRKVSLFYLITEKQ